MGSQKTSDLTSEKVLLLPYPVSVSLCLKLHPCHYRGSWEIIHFIQYLLPEFRQTLTYLPCHCAVNKYLSTFTVTMAHTQLLCHNGQVYSYWVYLLTCRLPDNSCKTIRQGLKITAVCTNYWDLSDPWQHLGRITSYGSR